jgi:hypothetical protein
MAPSPWPRLIFCPEEIVHHIYGAVLLVAAWAWLTRSDLLH